MCRLLALLTLLTLGLPPLRAQRCGLTDTIQIADFGSTEVVIPIRGYVNGRLTNQAQGLCGITLHFQHSYVYDLTVTLRSPAGEELQLVGPINAQTRPPTTLARWFIDYVPCLEPANPDPGAPIRWDNNDSFNWGAFGLYTGSYRPVRNCLEDFNVGLVNGDWTLIFDNQRAGEQGILTYVLLEFCDDRHLEGPCCFADAGELQPDPTVVLCEDPADLPLDLAPRYRVPRPDTAAYDYTYLVSRNDSILLEQSTPNLAGLPAGDYEICGFSYRDGELGQLPLDGRFSFTDLRADLDGANPTLCGDLTPICQTVRLTPVPDTTYLNERLCVGGSYVLGGQDFDSTGRYVVDLPGFAGCDSTVVLDLDVVTQLNTFVDTTICNAAAFVVGDSVYTQPGSYLDTIPSVFGCDSIVRLNLAVAPPISEDVTVAICAPDSFYVGSEGFGTSGRFTRVVPAANGCDSTVNLDLIVLDPAISIAPHANELTCAADTILLDATGSRLDFGAAFFWADTAGNVLANDLSLNVTEGGSYIFTLRAAIRGLTCTTRDTVTISDRRFRVTNSLARPQVPCDFSSELCRTLTCADTQLGVLATPDSLGPTYFYAWNGPTSTAIAGRADSSFAVITEPGNYTLSVVDSATACRLDTSFVITEDVDPVSVALSGNALLNCVRLFDTLVADTSQARFGELGYAWLSDQLTAPATGPTLRVNRPGEYTLVVTNGTNGCRADTTFTVERDVSPVNLLLSPAGLPPALTCRDPTQTFDASASTSTNGVDFAWILGPDTVARTPTVILDRSGDYRLMLTDRRSGCTATRPLLIPADTLRPTTEAGPDTVQLDCYASNHRLGTEITTTGPIFRHAWTDVNAPADTLGRTPYLDIAPPGGFFVLATENVRNGCLTRDSVRVPVDLDPPNLRPALPLDFDCFIDSVTLDLSATPVDFRAQRNWSGPCLPADQDRDRLPVFCPGDYTYTLTNLDNGCAADTTLEIGLAQTGVVAVLPDTFRLNCGTGEVQLDRRLATDAPVVRWELDGVPITLFGSQPTVTVPGEYTLILGNFNESCLDTAYTTVVADCPAFAAVVPPDSLTCVRPAVTLNAENSVPDRGDFAAVEWLTPPAALFQAGATDRQLTVFSPGRYGFVVRNTLAGVADTVFVEVRRNQVEPLAEAGPRDTINCFNPAVTLNGTASASGPLYDYVWTTTRDDTIGFNRVETVTTAGTYLLRVTQRETGCSRVDNVTIVRDLNPPDFDFTTPEIPCDTLNFPLAVLTNGSGPFAYAWRGPAVLSAADGDTARIGAVGWYFVDVQDLDNGCVGTDSVLVRRLPCPPFPALTDTSLTCTNPLPVLRPVFRDGCDNCTFRWQRNGVNLPGETDSLLRVSTTGTYTLVATNAFGLVSRAEARVTDTRTVPEGNAGPDRTLTCTRASVRLGARVAAPGFDYAYRWSRVGGGVAAGATQDTLRVEQGGAYVLETTNLFSGCAVRDTALVTYDTLPPLANAGPERLLTCDQKQRVLDGIDSDLGRRFRYAWRSAVSPLCIEGETTLNPAVRCAGKYYLTVVDTVNGCQGVDSVLVSNDDELPPVEPLADTTLNCAVQRIELQGGPFSGGAFSNHWEEIRRNEIVPVPEIAPGRIRVVEPGRFRFVAINDLTGCTNEFELEVLADRNVPRAEAGALDTFFCALDSLILRGVADGRGTPDLVTNWRSRTGFFVGNERTPNATIFQPDLYYFEVFNPVNQCSALDSVLIERDVEAPVAEAGRDTSLNCLRRSLALTGSWTSQSGEGAVEWTVLEGRLLSGATSLMPTVGASGRYQMNVVDPVSGCRGADIVSVGEDTLRPDARITGDVGLPLNCYARNRELLGLASSGAGALDYAWLRGNTDIGAGERLVVTQTGTYTLAVTDRGNFCRDTTSVFVAEDFAPPEFSTIRPEILDCNREETFLRIRDPQLNDVQTYRWSDQDGTDLGSGFLINVTEAGTYRVRTLNVANGCVDSMAVIVREDRTPPVVTLLPPDTLNCERATVAIRAAGSDRGPELIPNWTTSGGFFTPTEDLYTVAATQPGMYTLTVRNNANGCRASDSVEVRRSAILIEDFLVETIQPACPTDITGAALVEGVVGGRGPFRYRINGGNLTDRLVYEDLPLGDYQLEVFGADGCRMERTFTLLPGEDVQLALRRDTFIRLGDTVALNFSTNLPRYDTLLWTSNGPLPDSINPGALLVSPLQSQSYRLRIIGDDGCTATTSVVIEVDGTPAIYVPTAFSPNGDGTNDLLRPYVGQQVADILDFRLYDRWGEKVYDLAADPDRDTEVFGWDGRLNGKVLNPQLFTWAMRVRLLDGTIVVEGGEAMLVR